jgi:hypothetical protein
VGIATGVARGAAFFDGSIPLVKSVVTPNHFEQLHKYIPASLAQIEPILFGRRP